MEGLLSTGPTPSSFGICSLIIVPCTSMCIFLSSPCPLFSLVTVLFLNHVSLLPSSATLFHLSLVACPLLPRPQLHVHYFCCPQLYVRSSPVLSLISTLSTVLAYMSSLFRPRLNVHSATSPLGPHVHSTTVTLLQ